MLVLNQACVSRERQALRNDATMNQGEEKLRIGQATARMIKKTIPPPATPTAPSRRKKTAVVKPRNLPVLLSSTLRRVYRTRATRRTIRRRVKISSVKFENCWTIRI
uniref:Uncharacterized protein n=1 Tax=Cacopsylla melanoneura TaxID=428564 RepID=A0A8D8Y9J7_9HEMI